MAASNTSLAVLFLLALVPSAVPATAGGKYSGARMVIIRGPATTTRPGGAARSNNNGRQHYRRLEDEVAPELGVGGGLLLGAGESGIGYGALEKNKPAYGDPKPGEPYTGRGCTYNEKCPH